MRINSNISSLSAQRSLSTISKALQRSLERLASGKQINFASDNASGLAVSIGLKAQAQGLARTVQNINEAFGYLNTADGALQVQVDLVQRMRELAVQASNGTLSSEDRSAIQLELDQLLEEFNRIAETTDFNGNQLLNGSLSDLSLQVGTQKGQTIDLSIDSSLERDVFTEEVLESTNDFSSTSMNIGIDNFDTKFSDFNGDGADDFVTSDGGVAKVFLNDGEGSFNLSETFYVSAQVFEIADFSNDGSVDIIFATSGGERVVKLNSGSGRFSSTQTTTLNSSQTELESIVDFNNDGFLDILNKNTLSTTFTVNYGLGTGAFSGPVTVFTTGSFNNSAHIEDLNNDGYLDIMFGRAASNARYVRIGSASGVFTTTTTISSVTTAERGLTGARYEVTDMNGDGYMDLIDQDTLGNLEIRFGNSTGDYTLLNESALGAGYSRIFAGDFDGDGDQDIAAGNATTGLSEIRLNSGGGGLSAGTPLNFGAASWQLEAVEDFNQDGKDDILVNRVGLGSIAQWNASGSGAFSVATTMSISNSMSEFEYDDLNQDGFLDIYQYNQLSTRMEVLFSESGVLSNKQLFTHLDPTSSFSFSYEGTADLNGDGFVDFAFLESDLFDGSLSFLTQGTSSSTESVSVNLETQSSAQDSLEILDTALASLNERRSQIGALQNRLESVANANTLSRENLLMAYSQIVDADIATETADFARNQMLQQAATSVLAQANTSLLLALNLLK